MIHIAPERFAEILDKAHRLSYKELGPIYITAALMVEVGADPKELATYIEGKYLEEGV